MKKILSISLVAALMLTLCGCHNSAAEKSQQESSIVQTTQSELPAGDLAQQTECVAIPQLDALFLTDRSLDDAQCEPIGDDIDCEEILLQRADDLKRLFTDYLGIGASPVFELGAPLSGDIRPIISDEFDSYDGFKALFADFVSESYFDKAAAARVFENNGTLYFGGSSESAGVTALYLSTILTGNKIVGRYYVEWENGAALGANDSATYAFVNVVVQKIDGKYLVTDVSGRYDPNPNYYRADNSLDDAKCEPIGDDIDCEEILLQRADDLKRLMSSYLGKDNDSLAFSLGEPLHQNSQNDVYPIISDEFNSYEEFKALFANSICEGIFDEIVFSRISEEYGEMYFAEAPIYRGAVDSWCVGIDVSEYKIVGRFAKLKYDEGMDGLTAEHINDLANYEFYTITVQNVAGKYLVTDCSGENGALSDYYNDHGRIYNSHYANRDLITNEDIKPAF